MRSFEADEDVGRMLDRSSRHGIKQVFVCNEAVRRYLTARGFGPGQRPKANPDER
jgi:N-acetylglutamate synthase-like GNAT family acetyltransferase